MIRLMVRLLGFLCLAIGVVGILTPIPFGLIFVVLAFLLLIPTTPSATRMLQRLRRRFPWFDRMMASIIRRLPSPYRRILRETDVDILDRY